MDDKDVKDFITLACGHGDCCKECLIQHINHPLNEKVAGGLICPNKECKQKLTDNDVRTVLVNNKEMIDKYNDYLMHLYFMDLMMKGQAKHCPTPNCNGWYEVEGSVIETDYECPLCHQHYCSNCQLQHDAMTSCDAAKRAAQPGMSNADWIEQNTKPCPKCGNRIEKNGGCPYVYCRCGHGFCWNCFRTGENHHMAYVWGCTLDPIDNPFLKNNTTH